MEFMYRPYKCQHCQESYFRKYQLTKHLKLHSKGGKKITRLSNYEFYSTIFDQQLSDLIKPAETKPGAMEVQEKCLSEASVSSSL